MIGERLIRLLQHEHTQAVTAASLTVGEFVTGAYLLVHEGHILALYLAVTYLMRETSGGKHYHEVVFAAVKRIKPKKD